MATRKAKGIEDPRIGITSNSEPPPGRLERLAHLDTTEGDRHVPAGWHL